METTKLYDGDGAFPYAPTGDGVGQPFPHAGMSLRDWFAGQAIGTMIYKCENHDGGWDMSAVATGCYALADLMLEARGLK